MLELGPATRALRRQLEVLRACDDREIEAVFATLAGSPARALLIANDPLFRQPQTQSRAMEKKIKQLLELISELVDGGDPYRGKAQMIREAASDDQRIALDEFVSWFKPEEKKVP
jgi:hypothetical protein